MAAYEIYPANSVRSIHSLLQEYGVDIYIELSPTYQAIRGLASEDLGLCHWSELR